MENLPGSMIRHFIKRPMFVRSVPYALINKIGGAFHQNRKLTNCLYWWLREYININAVRDKSSIIHFLIDNIIYACPILVFWILRAIMY